MTVWPRQITFTGPRVVAADTTSSSSSSSSSSPGAHDETSKLNRSPMEYSFYGGTTTTTSASTLNSNPASPRRALDQQQQPLLDHSSVCSTAESSGITRVPSLLLDLMTLDRSSPKPPTTATTETSVATSEGDVLSASIDVVEETGDEETSLQDPFEIHEKLGVIPLAVIIFYSVSGGAFGVEETVRSAGNFYTLLGFLVMPFIWSMQEALMTAELGSAFPEASGGVAWVQEAYGNCAGWMSGYLNWISGATDNAIYPVLFVEYLLQQVNGDSNAISPFAKFCMFTGMSCLLAYMNWLGLPLVGKMSMTICFVAISPFIIMSVVGAFQVDPSRWLEPPRALDEDDSSDASVGLFSMAALGNIAWRPFLNNLFWNLNSFGEFKFACTVGGRIPYLIFILQTMRRPSLQMSKIQPQFSHERWDGPS